MKSLNIIEELIEKKIEDIIKSLGYELYDVEYIKEDVNNYLRIYIESQKGISLEDCEKVSKNIDDIIDGIEELKEQYFLEVSSTGLEKTIRKEKHLKNNIGNKIKINLIKKQDGKKTQLGILKNFDDKQLILNTKDKELSINRDNINYIKTVYDW